MSEVILGQLVDDGALRVDIPTLVDTRALITGNSGAGKSRLLRRLAEQAFGKVQQIIIDPEGEFATLREKHDFLLAGKGGEVPAEPRAAALLARRLMELRASAVLDLYDLKIHEQRGFVRLFLEALLSLPRDQYRPVLLMVDEVHRFAPEKGHGEAESTGAVVDLMSQGRKRGLCGVLASQRLSKVSKDAAAEAANGFIGRTTLDVDQRRAADALGITAAAERIALRDLDNGYFHAYGPAINRKGVVLFRGGEVLTTHPKAGQRHKVEPPAPPDAIRRLADELKDLPAQAAEEIRSLQAAKLRIRDLERELKARPTEKVEREKVVTKTVERAVLKDAQVKRLEVVVEQLRRLEEARLRSAKRDEMIAHSLGNVAQVLVGELGRVTSAIQRSQQAHSGAGGSGAAEPLRSVPPVPHSVRVPVAARRSEPAEGLTGPEQRILDAIAWLESLGQREADQTAVAFLAGYTVGGGAFNNPRGALRTKGLITYRGDRLSLTDQGRALANTPAEALTPQELQARVLERLPGPETKLLRELIAAYPEPLSQDELAKRAGYEPGGGAFNNPRGRLRTLGLVDYPAPGQVVAKPVLFLEGAA